MIGRVATTIVAALGVSAVVMAATTEPEPPLRCMDDELREQVRGLMMQATDDALKDHIKHSFDIWMKDPSDQPKRARAGLRQGLDAYMRARSGALSFSPPPCKESQK